MPPYVERSEYHLELSLVRNPRSYKDLQLSDESQKSVRSWRNIPVVSAKCVIDQPTSDISTTTITYSVMMLNATTRPRCVLRFLLHAQQYPIYGNRHGT
ncbi:hypothetical protein J6590_017056 [Homalodisca vitripennis]|nr:hypothetical protein J6590_017056 [Homalodisca vitripennis]